MYKLLIRPLLFLLTPERAHYFTIGALRALFAIPGIKEVLRSIFTYHDPRLKRTLFGLTFANPVGLAAGFDKDAKLVNEMATFGFGFIEIGTLTPKAQTGNQKPRLFRLPADHALINRMGFNNEGVLASINRLKKRPAGIIVGGNIGKNKITTNDEAVEDYRYCFEALHPYVDYFVINVSSPNTPGLRALQEKEPLKRLLMEVKGLNAEKMPVRPVLLKIAPDLSVEQLDDIIEILKETDTDGVIATNTTTSREGLETSVEEIEKIGMGGLSGRPLALSSTNIIRYLRKQMGPAYPIIGVGGIMSPQDALEKVAAGANLIQIYTAFIYEGPSIVKQINKALASA